jgi:hypothetical protein
VGTLIAGAVCAVAVVAGTGWLYLISGTASLAIGPRVPGALPLQQLAGQDAQPLLRVAIAWLASGVTAGTLLAWLTHLRRATGTAIVGALAALLLVLAGAASDAVAVSEPVVAHLAAQLQRPGVWVESGLLAAGALIAPWRRRSRGWERSAQTIAR